VINVNIQKKFSKITKGNSTNAIALAYFEELYRACVIVDLKENTFYVQEIANYPNTNYLGIDEIIQNAISKLGSNYAPNASATSITEKEFTEILKEHNLGKDFILKIKEKFPDDVVENILG
jgi:hypothetical protein